MYWISAYWGPIQYKIMLAKNPRPLFQKGAKQGGGQEWYVFGLNRATRGVPKGAFSRKFLSSLRRHFNAGGSDRVQPDQRSSLEFIVSPAKLQISIIPQVPLCFAQLWKSIAPQRKFWRIWYSATSTKQEEEPAECY